MSRRVGSLDRPQRYGARSLAVFEKLASGGLFFKLDGRREPVWSNQRWTKLDGTSMRGHVPVDAPPHGAWLGGSILASMGTHQELWMSRAEFEEHGPGLISRKGFQYCW